MARYDPFNHHRRSTRWHGYDYAARGAYFITICIHGRMRLLGHVVEAHLTLNQAGAMVMQTWQALPTRWPDLALDAFVIMPNHLHGILWLGYGERPPSPQDVTYAAGVGNAAARAPARGTQPGSLSRIVQAFKTASTRAYATGVRDHGWAPYEGHLWQRGYHDRVVRSPQELEAIRAYIRANPANWPHDPENVA
jgi:putative transposase